MPGGVCAVLDYNVELMAEYVAEMSTRLALPSSRTPESFRKFISQILSSTRLPRTTILLGMNYFAKRINMMNMMSHNAKCTLSEGQVWRLLTVALLLGSKFLDDNTFQNRSWADVSGIPVRELNDLEREWMDAIGWCLYVNLDRSEDYNAWINSWSEWETAKKRQQAAAARERLASIVIPTETDIANSRAVAYTAWHQQQVAEYERLSRLKHTEQSMQHDYRSRELGWPYQQPVEPWSSAPLTPPDSGYGTPDYINSTASINAQYNDWFNQQTQQVASRAISNGHYGRPLYQASANPVGYYARNAPAKLPTYNFYGHSIWEHSVDNGASMNCAHHSHHTKQGPYFGPAHPYGQPVVG